MTEIVIIFTVDDSLSAEMLHDALCEVVHKGEKIGEFVAGKITDIQVDDFLDGDKAI
jgi:hypothetical protein